jgi:hypothetical protein
VLCMSSSVKVCMGLAHPGKCISGGYHTTRLSCNAHICAGVLLL